MAQRFAHSWQEHLSPGAAQRFDVGRWSAREDALLRRAYAECCAESGLVTEAERQRPVTEPARVAGARQIWLDVASRFERRTVRAVMRRATRLLHPGNHKGAWQPAEKQRLAELVAARGRAWKDIGALLGRLPHGCAGAFAKMVAAGEAVEPGPAAQLPDKKGGGGESGDHGDDNDDGDGDEDDEEGGRGSARLSSSSAKRPRPPAVAEPRQLQRGKWGADEERALLRLVRRYGRATADGGYSDVAWASVTAGLDYRRSVSQCESKWAHHSTRILLRDRAGVEPEAGSDLDAGAAAGAGEGAGVGAGGGEGACWEDDSERADARRAAKRARKAARRQAAEAEAAAVAAEAVNAPALDEVPGAESVEAGEARRAAKSARKELRRVRREARQQRRQHDEAAAANDSEIR